MDALRIDIWSDIACPWCYVGKRQLERALERFEPTVDIEWHSFELDPSMPEELDLGEGSYAARIARKYRVSVAGAESMIARMTDTAAAAGLDFDFTRIRPGSTFDAHRVLHFAKSRGRQGALKERLLRAYLCEGELMSDHTALARLAAEVDLEPDEVLAVLGSDDHADDVRRDEAEARDVGITGVPFFVVGRRYAIPGAQQPDTILRVLDRAQQEREPALIAGAMCGPDGC